MPVQQEVPVGITEGDFATLEAIAMFVKTGIMTRAQDAEIALVSTFSVATTRRALSKWERLGVLQRVGVGRARWITVANRALYLDFLHSRGRGRAALPPTSVQ